MGDVSTRPGQVVAIGEIVVEIMAEAPGRGFREPMVLRGPFPSGAPAIFIDQVGRLGQPASLISAVGDDDFGHMVIERLRADGVGTDAIKVAASRVTGSAFVRYREDGERDFVFNIRDSANGLIELDAGSRALLREAAHLHVVGSSLFSPSVVAAAQEAVQIVRAGGGTVSLDPNARREMLASGGMREALETMLRRCDLFMPSGDELTLLTQAQSEHAAVEEILSAGVGAVLLKRGRGGASYFDGDGRTDVAAFAVTEIDPTGAGDCFGGAFVACRRQGLDVPDALRLAAAAGARAVSALGPMEGASGRAALEAFLVEQEGRNGR